MSRKTKYIELSSTAMGIARELGVAASRDEFRVWLRSSKEPEHTRYSGRVEDHFTTMRNGGSAPREMGESYLQFLISLSHAPLNSDKDLHPSTTPFNTRIEKPYSKWPHLQNTLRYTRPGQFEPNSRMFCTAEDIPALCDMLRYCVGYQYRIRGQELDRESCIARGGLLLPWKGPALEEWFTMLQAHQTQSIMYAVVNEVRIAVCVTIGVTDKWDRQFNETEIASHEIGPDDLQSPSKNVFIAACGIDHEVTDSLDEEDCLIEQLFCNISNCLSYKRI